jgi:hypothetical protein
MFLYHLVGKAAEIEPRGIDALAPLRIGLSNPSRRCRRSVTISNPIPSMTLATSSPTFGRLETMRASATVPAEMRSWSSLSNEAMPYGLRLIQDDRHNAPRCRQQSSGQSTISIEKSWLRAAPLPWRSPGRLREARRDFRSGGARSSARRTTARPDIIWSKSRKRGSGPGRFGTAQSGDAQSGSADAASSARHQLQPGRRMEGAHQQVHRDHSA